MGKIGVELKINVNNIDKTKMYKGEKGNYLTMTAFIDTDEQDQYGNNGMITQKLNKADSDAGQKGAILGNSKVFWQEQGQATQAQQPPRQPKMEDFPSSEDIPF